MALFHAIILPSLSMANVASGRKSMMSARRFRDSATIISARCLVTAWRPVSEFHELGFGSPLSGGRSPRLRQRFDDDFLPPPAVKMMKGVLSPFARRALRRSSRSWRHLVIRDHDIEFSLFKRARPALAESETSTEKSFHAFEESLPRKRGPIIVYVKAE
jgi:hypothetical protein